MNTASFMEARGVPGRINISETVAGHVKTLFELEPRCSIEAKHERAHEMFPVGELTQHCGSDAAHSECESKEKARNHADPAGHQLLGINKNCRERR